MSIRSSCLWTTGVLLLLLAWGAVLVGAAHGHDETPLEQGSGNGAAGARAKAFKDELQAWLGQHYQPLLNEGLYSPANDMSRYLALYHTVSGQIIPLFGQGTEQGEGASIPVPVGLSQDLVQHAPELAQEWLFVIVDHSGQPSHLIDAVTDRALDWPFFQAGFHGHDTLGVLDLGALDGASREGMLGLVDLSLPNASPLVVLSNISHGLEMAEVSTGLLRVLATLPESQKDKLGFVVTHGPSAAPEISHLLQPLNGLQPIEAEDHRQNLSLSLLASHALLKQPAVANTSRGREFELVVGRGAKTGQIKYHRLAAMEPIERWSHIQRSFTTLAIPVRALQTLASSPYLRYHSLAILEYDASAKRRNIYKLSSPAYGSVLYRVVALAGQNETQAASASISFQLPTVQASSYTPPLAQPTADPAADSLDDVDLPLPVRRTTKAAKRAKPKPKLVLRPLQLDPHQITRTFETSALPPRQLTRIHPQEILVTANADQGKAKPAAKEKSPTPSLVDNANTVFQAIRAQDERDGVMAKEAVKQPAVQPVKPMVADWGKGEPSGFRPPPAPRPAVERPLSEPKPAPFEPAKGSFGGRGANIRDMSQMRAEQQRAEQDAELAASLAQGRSDALSRGQDQNVRAPIPSQQLQLLPDQHPVERFGHWLGHYVTSHPIHTVTMAAGVIASLNILRQWQSYPTVRDHLFNDTLALMPASIQPMWRQALEILVYGTPDNLLGVWSPDALHWWVSSACERWCARTPCDGRQLSDIFAHYVLAPVTSDARQLQQEIELRITEQPLGAAHGRDTPWHRAIAHRRQGWPAALDFNPVTRQEWLVTLNDQGQLLDAQTQTDARHMPVKVLRRSFLETPITMAHHRRYQVLAQGSLTDVTNQYSSLIAPYPNERFRYGLYTCSTIDGDNWWVLDVADSKPGMHALPALTGFGHEQERGRCKVPAMDQWVSVLNESGQITTLVPDESALVSVDVPLAELMAGVDEGLLNRDHCQIHYLNKRHWHVLPTLEQEPGVLSVALPSQALYRLRCAGATTLFTLSDTQDSFELWSWAEHQTRPSQESHPLEPALESH